jgi:hypothetical protein
MTPRMPSATERAANEPAALLLGGMNYPGYAVDDEPAAQLHIDQGPRLQTLRQEQADAVGRDIPHDG